MFEAQCPQCSATYQVDERRVPQQGLKMRCPKCGESFQVTVPVHSDPPVLGAALGLSAAQASPPSARSRHKPTMMGVAEPSEGNRPAPPRPPGRPPGARKTMLGVAPAADRLELEDIDDEGPVESDGGLSLDLEPRKASEEADLPSPSPSRRGATAQIDLPSIPAPKRSSNPPPDSDEADLSGTSVPLPDLLDDEFDLPALGEAADLPQRSPAGLPQAVEPALPELSDDLPDLDAQLPDLDGRLPAVQGKSETQQSAAQRPAPPRPAPPRPPSRQVPEPGNVEALDSSDFESTAPPGWTNTADVGDELGASADDIFGHGPPTTPESAPPSRGSGGAASFGEVNLSGDDPPDDEEEFDAFPTEQGPVETTTSGAGAGYGDVVLEGGGGDFDLGADIERPQAPGGAAGPGGPAAAASAAVELPKPQGTEKGMRRKKRRKASGLSKGTRIAIASVLVAAVAGGALASFVPDVGPYGVYYVLDTLRADEYRTQLKADLQAAEKLVAMDTSSELERAFQLVERGRSDAPRYYPRTAYAAHLGFLHQLRFGAGSDVSARAEVFLNELSELAPDAQYVDLAEMTRDAAQGKPKLVLVQANQKLDNGIEYAAVIGEAALLAADEKIAERAWKKALSLEDSARSHYGMARTLALIGAPQDELLKHVRATLTQNPRHAGARLIEAQFLLKSRNTDEQVLKSLAPLVEKDAAVSTAERVQALSLLGELHLRQARLKKAEEAFAGALSADAGSWQAQRGLAQVYFQSGRYSEALARFEGARRAAPNDLATSLGVVRSKLELEQLEDAVKLLDELKKKHPKSAAVSYWVGRGKEAIGEKEIAQKAYEEAIQSDDEVPELVLSYVALTRLLGQRGHFSEASEVISQAEKRFPDDPAVYEALGQLSASSGRFDDAIGHYDKAISLDPNNLGLKFARGIALRQARRFEQAAAAFDSVEKESPKYPGLALERGNLYEASGKSEEALAAYEAALAEAPEDIDLQLRVACGKAGAGQTKEAIKMLEPIVEQREGSAEVNFCLGLAHLKADNVHEARRFLQRAASRDPTRAKHHLYVGWTALAMDDLSLANASLQRAIDMDQTLADAYWKRGELRVRQKAVRDALDDLDKALELAPSRSEAHAQKALAYIELGQEQDAIASFQHAVAGEAVDPYWRYKYGELLLANRQVEPAREQLQSAVSQAEKEGDAVWLPNAHRMLALTLGNTVEAIPHYQAYIEAKKGDPQDPYLMDAIQAVNRIAKSKGYD